MARYNFQLPRSQSKFKAFSSTLDIICTTVHASKGLEADYVLLLNVSNEKFGFPSLIEDDPLVRLVLPKAEDFPYAEERRLFYVALTRAKRGAFLFSRRQAMSPFISEILNHGNVSAPLSLKNTLTRNIASGELGQASTCPKCGDGTLQIKTDKKGANKPFLGCSKYPSCRHTVQLVRCPKCNSGKLVRRVNRQSRQVFYPCSSFDCDFRYKNTGYKKP